METNQTAARAAKRFLDERIRTDWAFPAVPPPWEASDEEVTAATGFRERYYGDSESSDSDAESRTPTTTTTTAAAATATQQTGDEAYKFDTPDAIGDAVAARRVSRKKRRRARLQSEMCENEGLRIWVQRRDAWTGVASVRKHGTKRRRRSQPAQQDPSGVAAGDPMQLDATSPTTLSPSSPTTTTPAPAPATTTQAVQPDTDTDLTPVAPPLLPSNPIRASITPRSYPDIYAKIVASSRTPSVPINLADMTRALVQGWKDTNEWPPKVGAVDPLAGRKRAKGGGGLGLLGGGGGEGGGFMMRHPHLEKGVGSVKKILHLHGGGGQQEG